MKHQTYRKPPALSILACAVAATLLVPGQVFADEREDLEKLRATVLGLVDTLVNGGLVPREQADNMMRDAQKKANARLSQTPPAPITPDGKKIVRVPYIPDAVKTQMRDEIKAQVLAETREARTSLAGPGSGVVRIEGDLRVRQEAVFLDPKNFSANTIVGRGDLTRDPEAYDSNDNGSSTYNTTENYNRVRIRARLAAVADVTEDIQALIGIATGGTNGPTSTNTSLGQSSDKTDKTGSYFNRYAVTLDRASIRYKGGYGVTVLAGRFNNPFMKTDLVWADDLNMDGVAASIAPAIAPGLDGFATVGWFPLSIANPKSSAAKNLMAIQGGVNWQLGMKDNRVKLAAALYRFNGVEGVKETDSDYYTRGDYLVRSEYGSNYRQRGNTMFLLNSPADLIDGKFPNAYGLASSFNELDLNAQMDVVQFEPYHITLNANYVKNLGFDRNAINKRTGLNLLDGKSSGYLLRGQIGTNGVKQMGDWNLSMAYRYLGSDAVVDAFTNSDFGLGGTNTKGFVLGGAYGLAKNTALNVKFMSSSLIDSIVPADAATTAMPTKFSADVLHVDLVTRF
jgi:hypothetical protein